MVSPKRLLSAASALLALTFVTGCGNTPPANGGAGASTSTGETPSAGKLTSSDKLEVAVFKGGYGSDFYEAAAKEYEKAHPGVQITIEASPDIASSIRPRFANGTPPDLTYPSWKFDHWTLVAQGQVMPLEDELKKDGWGDSFVPDILKMGQDNGHQYVMPFFYSVMGWWYDPKLFAAHGWAAPKTYEELLALCAKIKAAGIAPVTYQGMYPDYMISCMLCPWIVSAGGMADLDKIQNLEPGAWKQASVVKAAKMIRDLKDMGYFQDGAAAMSHTESQTQFLNGKAAMIPCGTWLHSEMEKSMPPGAQMEYFQPPVLADGKGDPSCVLIKIEPWFVPMKAKNQKDAVGFFKYMTSLDKAKQFVKEKGTLMAVKGSDEVDMPSYLKTPANFIKASKDVYGLQWKDWYTSLYTEVGNQLTLLVGGQLTPEQFADKCEEAAEKIRNDSEVVKHKLAK